MAHPSLRKFLRLWPAWIISAVVLVSVYYLYPQQMGTTAYKVTLITIGALLGLRANVWFEGRIDDKYREAGVEQRMLDRRALYVVGGMIALALAA